MDQRYRRAVKIIDYLLAIVSKVICLTCYFRHLKEVFAKAGIEVTKENRRGSDRIVRSNVGMEYEDCPAIWREVKKRIAEDEVGFVLALKDAWNSKK
jgi:hypothetical protein